MSNISEVLARSKALQKKYDKYLQSEQPKVKNEEKKGDRFDRELALLEDLAQELSEEAGKVPTLKDRALVAQKNADIRKRKQGLLSEIEKLRPLIKKGKTVTKEIVAQRQDRMAALEEGIAMIQDGVNAPRKKPGAPPAKSTGRFGFGSTSQADVRIEMGDMRNDGNGYYDETEENRGFQMEWQQRKAKQDEDLDVIEQGLGNLQNIAQDMGAEINKQDVLLDEIETQMDRASKAVETNNAKLAGVLKRVASTRNFCIDITLIIILLAVVGYIYTLLN